MMLELQNVLLKRNSQDFRYDLRVPAGEMLSIIGPSGAGKSTLLEIISGFASPDAGIVRIDSEDVTHQPVANRKVSYAFQHNALFPHISILKNVMLALHDQKITTDAQKLAAKNILAEMGLTSDLIMKRPGELSGGELTRANLARALLRPSKILLLDEPFAALDETARKRLLKLVRKLHEEKQLTTLFVTHHLEDAKELGQRILEVKNGILNL